MTAPDKAKIIERIRGCLNLADSKTNNQQHEVETALALAKKLMAEYNLTMDDVALNESLSRTNIRQEGIRVRSNIPKWEVQLAAQVREVEPQAHLTHHAPHGEDRGGCVVHVWERELSGYFPSAAQAWRDAIQKLKEKFT